jgi:hypothetical protein
LPRPASGSAYWFAIVVPFGGPIVIDEPLALMVLPEPIARKPICPADVAVVVEVVRSVLPLKLMVAPVCASAPVVVAAARLTVIPLPIIWPSSPEALFPTAPAGVTVRTEPGATVHIESTTTTGVGHACPSEGE